METDRSGWLIRETGDLAAALSVLGADVGYRRLSEGARDRARQLFSPAAVYPRLVALYENAAAAAGRRRESAASSDQTAIAAGAPVGSGHAVPSRS